MVSTSCPFQVLSSRLPSLTLPSNGIPRPIVTSPMTICFKSKRLSLLYPRFIFNLSGSPLSSLSYAPYITLPVSYTHLLAHETRHDLVCRLLLEKKKQTNQEKYI